MFIYPIYHHNWRNVNTIYLYGKLKDRKRSLSGKNDHNTLWH